MIKSSPLAIYDIMADLNNDPTIPGVEWAVSEDRESFALNLSKRSRFQSRISIKFNAKKNLIISAETRNWYSDLQVHSQWSMVHVHESLPSRPLGSEIQHVINMLERVLSFDMPPCSTND